jgi:hypothetical protein
MMSPSEAQHKHVIGRIGNNTSPQNKQPPSSNRSINAKSTSTPFTVEEEENDPYIPSGGGGYTSLSTDKDLFARRKTFCQECCAVGFDWDSELLEYDYSRLDRDNKQLLPRVRERGEYYIDSYNTEKWHCTFGTYEEVCLQLRNHQYSAELSLF